MKLYLYYPIQPFVISQKFGENLSPIYKTWGMQGHNGIDMVGTYGQVCRVAHDGIVTYAGYDNNEGLGIVIRTKEPFDYNGGISYFKSIYWHLLPESIKVKVDQEVKAGDIIGFCDSTGVLLGVKNGPIEKSHLHFGLKPMSQGENGWTWYNSEQNNGYNGAIDPEPFWNGMYAVDIPQYLTLIDLMKKLIEFLKVALLKKP